jgi:hypothetical protein
MPPQYAFSTPDSDRSSTGSGHGFFCTFMMTQVSCTHKKANEPCQLDPKQIQLLQQRARMNLAWADVHAILRQRSTSMQIIDRLQISFQKSYLLMKKLPKDKQAFAQRHALPWMRQGFDEAYQYCNLSAPEAASQY